MDKPVTLITGTSKGIGKALVEHYVSLGHHVIGCSRSAVDWKIEGAEGTYKHYIADVTDEIAVKAMFSDMRKQYGRLDHLINNAGIASMNHSMLTPLTTVHQVLGTNVVGTFLFCRESAKLMQKKRYGRIINFATVATPLKLEGEAIYAASKAAVITLTQIMAKEFGEYGITVNAIGPTPVQTDLIKSVPKGKIDSLLNRQAIKRFGQFHDISNVIDFFLKVESEFVTGQVIFLGGI
jgi:3-oxoacyl-[acyl-carrier protein] reductase